MAIKYHKASYAQHIPILLAKITFLGVGEYHHLNGYNEHRFVGHVVVLVHDLYLLFLPLRNNEFCLLQSPKVLALFHLPSVNLK